MFNFILQSTFIKLLKNGAILKSIPSMIVGTTEAEAIKLFSNAYLAMRVSFFNELDTFAVVKGIDSKSIIKGVCLDSRIGDYYNNPSFGYGGYCLPKDTKQLLAEYGFIKNSIFSAVVRSNDIRRNFIISMITARMEEIKSGQNLESIVVGVYRLTMKKGSDNFRNSAILDILLSIRAKQKVVIYEPILEKEVYLDCIVEKDFSKFKSECDLIIANRWAEEIFDVKQKVLTRDQFMNG